MVSRWNWRTDKWHAECVVLSGAIVLDKTQSKLGICKCVLAMAANRCRASDRLPPSTGPDAPYCSQAARPARTFGGGLLMETNGKTTYRKAQVAQSEPATFTS